MSENNNELDVFDVQRGYNLMSQGSISEDQFETIRENAGVERSNTDGGVSMLQIAIAVAAIAAVVVGGDL